MLSDSQAAAAQAPPSAVGEKTGGKRRTGASASKKQTENSQKVRKRAPTRPTDMQPDHRRASIKYTGWWDFLEERNKNPARARPGQMLSQESMISQPSKGPEQLRVDARSVQEGDPPAEESSRKRQHVELEHPGKAARVRCGPGDSQVAMLRQASSKSSDEASLPTPSEKDACAGKRQHVEADDAHGSENRSGEPVTRGKSAVATYGGSSWRLSKAGRHKEALQRLRLPDHQKRPEDKLIERPAFIFDLLMYG